MTTYIEATAANWESVHEFEHAGPIVMLNLLRFDVDNDGPARYATYGENVMPLLKQCGAEILYIGAAAATVIGGEDWDQMILVRYPTKQAFIGMLQSEAYQAIAHLRNDALLDSRLYMTVAQESF